MADPRGATIPGFVRSSPVLTSAFAFARWAHEPDELEHPVQVASLLHDAGFPPDVVAAGLLHDVVEDTDVRAADIEDRFGPRVGQLVAVLTENEDIGPYEERKSEHRTRIAKGGRDPLAIYAADKLAKARALNSQGGAVPRRQLAHYSRSLELLRDRQPELPFLRDLEEELHSLASQEAARRAVSQGRRATPQR